MSNSSDKSRHWHVRAAAAIAVLSLFPRAAHAGMPEAPMMTDIARMRVESISFFLFILFLSALLIQWLWNGLRRNFARLPRLSYPKAISLALLWGLLFMVVLLMISGARELMTPGAWEKTGATYRLKEGSK